jgi:aldehyde:ferredoxin oxidoreductase
MIHSCRVLRIDLSRRTHRVEEIPADIIRKVIGGRGLGAHLLYQSVPPKADPFGEKNHVILTDMPLIRP